MKKDAWLDVEELLVLWMQESAIGMSVLVTLLFNLCSCLESQKVLVGSSSTVVRFKCSNCAIAIWTFEEKNQLQLELTVVGSLPPRESSFLWVESLSSACLAAGSASRLWVEFAVFLAANEPEMSEKSATPGCGLYDICVFNWGPFDTLTELYVRLGICRSCSWFLFLVHEGPSPLGCTPEWEKPFRAVASGPVSSCGLYLWLMLLGFAWTCSFYPAKKKKHKEEERNVSFESNGEWTRVQ